MRCAWWRIADTQYFTFLPDSVPSLLLRWFGGLERALERARFRPLSASYQACLRKQAPPVAR